MFAIRRRSTGKIVESGFKSREEGKELRNKMNKKFYKEVPEYDREYYIVRTKNHRKGESR